MFAGDIDLMIYGGLKRYSINKHLLRMLHGKTSEPKILTFLTFSQTLQKLLQLARKNPHNFHNTLQYKLYIQSICNNNL